MFMFTPPSVEAWGISSRSTSSGWIACQEGAVSACPVPTAKVNPSSSQAVTSPAMVRAPNNAAEASMNDWLASSTRRRSKMSPTAPAGTANRPIGRLIAVWTSATLSGSRLSVPISHWAPTVCIHVPMFEVNCAIHRAR